MQLRRVSSVSVRWGAAVLVMLPLWLLVGPTQQASADHTPFDRPLFIAPEIVVEAGDRVQLVADEAQVQVLDGGPTEMWLYNGTFPGPTIRQIASATGPAPVTVNLRNALEGKGPLTLHHHGNHSTPTNDGRSHNDIYVPDALIPQGADRDYVFEAWEDGATERGATQWYHDHLHGATTRNVAMGLAGMYIIEDPNDPAGLPSGRYEIPLMLTSAQFDADNQIMVPDIGGFLQVGDHDLVNGVPQPYFDAEPTLYRFRTLNAAAAKYYGLELWTGPDGTGTRIPIIVLGTEAGLMEAPLPTTANLLMGPAERLDLVFDLTGREGETVYLRTRDPNPIDGIPIATGDLMELRVGDTVTGAPGAVPATLRTDWPDLALQPIVAERTITFDRPTTGPNAGRWSVGNEVFDEERFLAEVELGTTEKWIFRNTTNVPHVVHIHDVDQHLVRRVNAAGAEVPAAPWEVHKESWLLPPQSSFEILIRFTDHLGPYLFHCHVLEHEDNGMMSQFLVVEETTTTTAPETTTTTAAPETTTTTAAPETTTTTAPETTTTTTTTTHETTPTTVAPALTTTTGVFTTTSTLPATTSTTVVGGAVDDDPFSDDDGSVFEGDIEKLAAAGITRGCNPPDNDRFCPELPVNRGQMAAFLGRALGLTDSGRRDFVDDDDSGFEVEIERLAHAGITLGCNPPTNDRFCPDDPVTRGQMAAFLRRALEDRLGAGLPAEFVDDGDSPFEGDIEWLASTGVTRGCNPPANDRFCPDDPVTRGQMAAFLVRALNLGGSVEQSRPVNAPPVGQPSLVFMDMLSYMQVTLQPRAATPGEYLGGLDLFCRF
jgi:spore coat protein A, manganese oxidase